MQAGLGKKLAEPSAALPNLGVAERFARFVKRHPGGRWKILDNLWRGLVRPGEENVTMSVRLNARASWQSLSHGLDGSVNGSAPVESLLVWTMAAHDLGAISRIGLLERMESLLADCSVAISDSGDLAPFLRDLALRCHEVSLQPMFDKRVLDGLSDTLLLMKNELQKRGEPILRDLSDEIENCFVRVSGHRKADARAIDSWADFLNDIRERAAVMEDLLVSCSSINVEGLRLWVDEFSQQAKELHYDVQLCAPWTSVNTAELDSIIRSHCPSLFPQWSHINKVLEPIPIISLRPERLAQLLPEIAHLRCELQLTPPLERDLALRRCDELINAIESALRVASDIKLRYEDLIERYHLFESAQTRDKFDEEYACSFK